MNTLYKIALFFCLLFFVSCSSDTNSNTENTEPKNYKYLALGDSYTIGQSVYETCRFPIQLQDSISKYIDDIDTFQSILDRLSNEAFEKHTNKRLKDLLDEIDWRHDTFYFWFVTNLKIENQIV